VGTVGGSVERTRRWWCHRTAAVENGFWRQVERGNEGSAAHALARDVRGIRCRCEEPRARSRATGMGAGRSSYRLWGHLAPVTIFGNLIRNDPARKARCAFPRHCVPGGRCPATPLAPPRSRCTRGGHTARQSFIRRATESRFQGCRGRIKSGSAGLACQLLWSAQ